MRKGRTFFCSLICFVLVGLVVAPAMANITIPWRDSQFGTYQAWTFDTDPGFQTVNGVASVLGVAANPSAVNGYGDPLADIYATDDQLWGGWYAEAPFTDPGQGVVYGGRVDFDLHIPNIEMPDWIKIVQVEIRFWNSAESQGGYISSSIEAGGKTYLPVSEVLTPETKGVWQDVTIEFHIPQLDFELISVHLVDSGVYMDSIEVATICIPEPATMSLLVMGGMLLLLKRK